MFDAIATVSAGGTHEQFIRRWRQCASVNNRKGRVRWPVSGASCSPARSQAPTLPNSPCATSPSCPRTTARRPRWPNWAERDVIDAFVGRGVTAPWSHQVRAATLAHQGRHVVISTGTASGKSLGLPVADSVRAGHEPPHPSAVSVTDQGSRPRSVALRGVADRGGRPARRRRAGVLRRRQPRRGPPVRARAVPMGVLQSGHDPSIDAAKPCPLGCVPAQPAIHRRRRMPLLPRHFRLQRGDGVKTPAAVVRALHRHPDSRLRQRHNGFAGSDGLRADRADSRRSDRRPVAPRCADRRAVGTRVARRHDRRARSAGAPLRGR